MLLHRHGYCNGRINELNIGLFPRDFSCSFLEWMEGLIDIASPISSRDFLSAMPNAF